MTRKNVNRIANWILIAITATFLECGLLFLVIPTTISAAETKEPEKVKASCDGPVLGFPTWYRSINKGGDDCELKSPSDFNKDGQNGLITYIWIIGLNILDIAMVAVLYIAVGFIIYGGFLFLVSNGKPESAANARKTILNAIIGLLISIASIVVVRFVYDKLRGVE